MTPYCYWIKRNVTPNTLSEQKYKQEIGPSGGVAPTPPTNQKSAWSGGSAPTPPTFNQEIGPSGGVAPTPPTNQKSAWSGGSAPTPPTNQKIGPIGGGAKMIGLSRLMRNSFKTPWKVINHNELI